MQGVVLVWGRVWGVPPPLLYFLERPQRFPYISLTSCRTSIKLSKNVSMCCTLFVILNLGLFWVRCSFFLFLLVFGSATRESLVCPGGAIHMFSAVLRTVCLGWSKRFPVAIYSKTVKNRAGGADNESRGRFLWSWWWFLWSWAWSRER